MQKKKLTDFAHMNSDSAPSLETWHLWMDFYLSLKVTELGLGNAMP